MAQEPLVLLFIFSESYALPGAVAIESALRHSPPGSTVVVGSGGLVASSVERIMRIVERHGARLLIVDVLPLSRPFPTVGRYPALAWTRLLAHRILEPGTQRAIYLDADVIVAAPLDVLGRVDLRSHSLGAVIDAEIRTHGERGAGYAEAVGSTPHSPYFNTGVLVMDVPGWIENRVEERSLELVRDADIPLDYIDQDVMNAIFLNGWHALDTRWNVRSDLLGADPFIVQFPSGIKPWEVSASGPYVEEYRALASELL